MARLFGVSFSVVKFWEQDRTLPTRGFHAQVEAFLNDPPQEGGQLPQMRETPKVRLPSLRTELLVGRRDQDSLASSFEL